jgi:hypothetical protein
MNALLDKLKDLFSKSFVISSFLPVFVCAAVNALLLYETSERFRLFVRKSQPTGSVAAVLQGGTVLFAIAVVASLISPSITFFREVLEGDHWLRPFNALRDSLIAAESDKLKNCEEHIRAVKYLRNQLAESDKAWIPALRNASNGPGGGAAYDPTKFPNMDLCSRAACAGKLLVAVPQTILKNCLDLQAAYTEVSTQLTAVVRPIPAELNAKWDEFINLLTYAKRRLDLEIVEKTYKRLRRWGQSGIKPTELGNLAQATAAYGMLRYGFSVEFGWSRLQQVLQKEAAIIGPMQDVKANFDSVITLFWLIAVTTVGWELYLVTQFSLGMFLLVAIGGGLACELLYRTAVTSYGAFGDLLRSSIDLFRFNLLTALHLPLPEGRHEEEAMWLRLRKQIEFGEAADLRYDHKAGATT